MAKKTVAEMTAEELEARHAKAKARRTQRRDNNREAITEIVGLLTEEQVKSLSDKAKHLVAVLQQEYKPGVQIEVHKGDKIMELLEKYRDVRNLFKKLQDRCEKQGFAMDFAKGVIA